jgi:hypothetical protein
LRFRVIEFRLRVTGFRFRIMPALGTTVHAAGTVVGSVTQRTGEIIVSDPTCDAATEALEKWRPIADQPPETSPIVPVHVLAGEALDLGVFSQLEDTPQ